MVVQAVKLGGAYPYFLSCFLLLNIHPKGCRIRCSAPTENHSSYSTDFNNWSNTENYTNCYLGISTGRNYQLNSHFDGWDVNIWDSCQAFPPKTQKVGEKPPGCLPWQQFTKFHLETCKDGFLRSVSQKIKIPFDGINNKTEVDQLVEKDQVWTLTGCCRWPMLEDCYLVD